MLRFGYKLDPTRLLSNPPAGVATLTGWSPVAPPNIGTRLGIHCSSILPKRLSGQNLFKKLRVVQGTSKASKS